MNILYVLVATILFVVLTPGVLLSLPKRASKMKQVGFHAVVYAILMIVLAKIMHMFFGKRLEGFNEGAAPALSAGSADCAPAEKLIKNDVFVNKLNANVADNIQILKKNVIVTYCSAVVGRICKGELKLTSLPMDGKTKTMKINELNNIIKNANENVESVINLCENKPTKEFFWSLADPKQEIKKILNPITSSPTSMKKDNLPTTLKPTQKLYQQTPGQQPPAKQPPAQQPPAQQPPAQQPPDKQPPAQQPPAQQPPAQQPPAGQKGLPPRGK